MSTKPTIADARFATGPGDDVAAPSSGLRDTGFVAGTPIVQSYVNYLLEQLYLWCLYLSEGDLTGGLAVDGGLAVTGGLTVDTYLWDAPRAQMIPGAAMASDDPTDPLNGPVYLDGSWELNSNSTIAVRAPVQVPVGSVITGWETYLNKTSAAGVVTARLYRRDLTDGTETAIGAAATNSANNPGYVSISTTGLSHTVLAANDYHIRISDDVASGDFVLAASFTRTGP